MASEQPKTKPYRPKCTEKSPFEESFWEKSEGLKEKKLSLLLITIL